MPRHLLKYTNRKKDDHYFRAVETAKGGIRYYITKNNPDKYDDLLEELPSGYEIVETPEEGRVIFRKIKPKKITEEERLIVEDGVRELSALNDFIVYTDDRLLTVYYSQFNYIQGIEENLTAEQSAEMWGNNLHRWKRYFEGFYFRLVDEKKRVFEVYRQVFIGWYDNKSNVLETSDDLHYLVNKYCPHLGRETFFDLVPPAWEED